MNGQPATTSSCMTRSRPLYAPSRQQLRVGLISNTHRSLASFESHFELTGLIAAAVASSEHGYMKPHRSIFDAALRLMNVQASEAVMVGDSVRQDIEGALSVGMRAILVHRSDEPHPRAGELAAMGVPVMGSLSELPSVLLLATKNTKTRKPLDCPCFRDFVAVLPVGHVIGRPPRRCRWM